MTVLSRNVGAIHELSLRSVTKRFQLLALFKKLWTHIKHNFKDKVRILACKDEGYFGCGSISFGVKSRLKPG